MKVISFCEIDQKESSHRQKIATRIMTQILAFKSTQGTNGTITAFPVTRVTRFGEFSPYGRFFSLGRFNKITEVCGANSWAFLSGTSYTLILTENGLGYTLDDFISNWSPCRLQSLQFESEELGTEG
jgi:hypothetical protein